MKLRFCDADHNTCPVCPAPEVTIGRMKVANSLPNACEAMRLLTINRVVFVGADWTTDTHLRGDA